MRKRLADEGPRYFWPFERAHTLRTGLIGLAVLGLASTCLAHTGQRPLRDPPAAFDSSPPPQPTVSATIMSLGAASNFSQGWSSALFQAARMLPLIRYRDSMNWAHVEKAPGIYRFDTERTTYPDQIARAGGKLTMTLNWGNPLYDDGKTPHSPQALAAFGKFAAAVVQRFPAIDTLEIGNEVNGGNFVNGPVKADGLAERGHYHLAMVLAAAQAVHAVRPQVTILGAATHSLPGGYINALLTLPGAQAIEGLAVHPYTTPIDQLRSQITYLRQNPRVAMRPIHVTEIGSQNRARSADDFIRLYASLAALQVAEMDWYPLNPRHDAMVPLIDEDGRPSPAGLAFRFAQRTLAHLPARDISPDPFTRVIAFGPNIWVLWGLPRTVRWDDKDIQLFDTRGTRLSQQNLTLAPDQAWILVGKAPLRAGQNIHFSCSSVLADSFYQFELTQGLPGFRGFAPFVLRKGQTSNLQPLPGQQRSNVPWNPYLGHKDRPGLRLMADSMRLGFKDPEDGSLGFRIPAPADGPLPFHAMFTPQGLDTPSIRVTVSLAGKLLAQNSGTLPLRLDATLPVRKGQDIVVEVAAQDAARPELSADAPFQYRLQILAGAACPLSKIPAAQQPD